jgi:DNA polymerase-3 subunit epsilon
VNVPLSFVAIDVETANSNRGSICSIGLAVVEEGQVVRVENWLTRPPANLDWFDGFNVSLHGISSAMVRNSPPFSERLTEVLQVVGDLPIVAHYAAFDTGAIRAACDSDAVPWPSLTYGCSMVLSRYSLNLLSNRLPIVCEALGISLVDHHKASEDARAAAEIVLELARRQQAGSLQELADSLGVRLGKLNAEGWSGSVHKQHGKPGPNAGLPPPNPDADPENNPFFGQAMVFTGTLSSMVRRDAWNVVAFFGAVVQDGVNRQTTRLVIGDGFTGNDVSDFTTGKALRAAELHAKGQKIEILSESDFLELLA